ncbi:F-box domain [Macleaya cordata]|uniref:F-box domain n=1 Tax=Macleaya cordata TaxID=56857 RepID=A0A200QFL6_MACCD|nr:F-box domain [Macleaya cordata]
MSMPTTSTLPEELTSEILSRLSVKLVSRFKSVCKAWRTLITDPVFIKLHLNRATTTAANNVHGRYYQPLFALTRDYYSIINGYGYGRMKSPIEEVIGFCNGLLCFIGIERAIILWNPSIREYQILPDPSTQFRRLRRLQVGWGFGFHPKTGEYKVIRIAPIHTRKQNRGRLSEVKVYTVGSGSWRELENIPYRLYDESRSPQAQQALINGVLHWCQCSSETSTNVILSFDIADEQFREVPRPVFGEGPARIRNLGVLRGCLSMLVERQKMSLGSVYEVWVMEDYGLKESWTKKINFSSSILGYNFRPWRLLDNGEILYRIGGGNMIRLFPSLKCETAEPRSLHNWGIHSCRLVYVADFVGSLVSPKQIENRVEKEQGKKRDEGSTLSTEKYKKLKRR